MIDTKSFLEFCKKEYHVDFVDMQTGKNALDIIQENNARKTCLSCRWAMNGDGKTLHKEDVVCVNGQSEYITEWVSSEMVCDFWNEAGENDEQT
jgi:hypothetical protein